jgi:hypothetical protein
MARKKKSKKTKGTVALDWNTPEGKQADNATKKRVISRIDEAGSDPTLIVLRGHLLVEDLLYGLLKTCVWHPEAIDQARLTFAQAVSIGRPPCSSLTCRSSGTPSRS